MFFKWKIIIAFLILSTAVFADAAQQLQPSIAYIYPAGAARDSEVEIIVGGQFLRNPTDVYVSGEGVHASVVRYFKPSRKLKKEQQWLLVDGMMKACLKQFKKAGLTTEEVEKTREQMIRSFPWSKLKKDMEIGEYTLPEHPLLANLEDKTLREVMHIASIFFFPREKLQLNPQLAALVTIRVKVDANAMPGDRELRLRSRLGLTNPVVFQVGQLPEQRELELNDLKAKQLPNGQHWWKELVKPVVLDVPILLNGCIMPGDVDRFRFRSQKGQRLVIEASARRLIPYLADAVPGWFQAVITLYDGDGKELAYADDYRGNPDPVLFFEVPQDGEYELGIRDSIYRGRHDFIYRVSISEDPFITGIFPLGGPEGKEVIASLSGWNLPAQELTLNTDSEGKWIRRAFIHTGKKLSNSIPYAVDNLPECYENESADVSNDERKAAQKINVPMIINGRIDTDGDSDLFQFNGNAGDQIVVEVSARRLDSPMDSLLRLMDESGKILAWNDDNYYKENNLHVDRLGLLTHHADSYLMAKLPETGTYFVQISDTQRHGGDYYAYRLRISHPRPDFSLRITPSSIYARPGIHIPFCIYALRRDGFDGEITVKIKDNETGFTSKRLVIPAGSNSAWMTITAPQKVTADVINLEFQGTAQIDGKTVHHDTVAADNVMQAFLYQHLVPARQLICAIKKQRRPVMSMELVSEDPVQLTSGTSAKVKINTSEKEDLQDIVLVIHNAPDGVSIEGPVAPVPDGFEFNLNISSGSKAKGFAGNLIIEVLKESFVNNKDGTQSKKKRRLSIGYLPATPIQIAAEGEKSGVGVSE